MEKAGQSLAMASTKVFLNDDYINKSVVCDTAQYNALQWFLRSLVLSLRGIAKLTTLHCESDCIGTIFQNIGSRKKKWKVCLFSKISDSGIVPMFAEQLFKEIETKRAKGGIEFEVKLSMLEIYNEVNTYQIFRHRAFRNYIF